MKGGEMLLLSYEDVQILRRLAETSLWDDEHHKSIKELSDDAFAVAEILYTLHEKGNIESIPDSEHKKIAMALIARVAQLKAV